MSSKSYQTLLAEIAETLGTAKAKAIAAVNAELLLSYLEYREIHCRIRTKGAGKSRLW